MYKSSSRRYIRSENPVFRWGYLGDFTPRSVTKLICMARGENPQGWVGVETWGSPVVALAPPTVTGVFQS